MLAPHLREVTRDWGSSKTISLYLDRCQVDTPDALVEATWNHVLQLRSSIGKVVDFGAGDGRFSRCGKYKEYVGYEIDKSRYQSILPTKKVRFINRCAFSQKIEDADLCIGNPPFVRNQDLPIGWRENASSILAKRTGISISGLANAWQYFFLLSLCSLKKNGLCALVIPYEWVSRPSSKALRDYITDNKWGVSVYRLVDATFESVLTTSSITIVDKRATDAKWNYFEETSSGVYKKLSSPSGAASGVINYSRRIQLNDSSPRAIRGLSPGTQKVLTLTEGERVRSGLAIGSDVVPCITTLRNIPAGITKLTESAFKKYFKNAGEKCWLIRTDKKISSNLSSYLDAIPPEQYNTSTCLEREDWWRFNMPRIPKLLMAMSFRGKFPKVIENTIEARAVGGVCGIYNISRKKGQILTQAIDQLDIRKRIVAHSNGLRKIEINQLNTLFCEMFGDKGE